MNEVTLSLCLFVCLFVSRITQKLENRFSQNYVAHGTQKNPLEFSVRYHAVLGLGTYRVRVTIDVPRQTRQNCVTVR